jgi:5-formyltetrahydrofolate cyclo-ligase
MPHDATRTGDTAPVGAALREAKRALRESVLARRDAMPAPLRRSAAKAITARIGALPTFAAARVVLLTLPFRNEWDTRPLFAAARGAGKRIALPRVDARQRMLELFEVRDLARDVATGFHGIDEPLAHCPPIAAAEVDWVLVPGVAFDAHCRRLGYGGGYYDRLLPLVPAAAPRTAGAFDVQIVERVPAAPHDLAIDAVVTETRMLRR